MSGCDDDPVDVGGDCESSVATHLIIANPLAPASGDTTQLTVQATGEGCGSWPSYHWTVGGGELIEDEGISVKWVAPEENGTYSIVCRASLSGTSPDTAATLILVRNVDYLETGKSLNLYPRVDGNAVRVIAEASNNTPTSPDFHGYFVYRRYSTGQMQILSATNDASGAGALDITYSRSNSSCVGSFFTGYNSIYRQQKMDVWRFSITFPGPGAEISQDPGGSFSLRRNQHRHPSPNYDGSKTVWKFHKVGLESDGTEDLFDIAYWDQSFGEGNWHTLTQSLDSSLVMTQVDTFYRRRFYHNVRPMFTPSDDNILYFVDTTGVFEPCLIPITGGDPDTLARRALMVDEETGIFEQAGVLINEKTVFQWNPGSEYMAFIAGGVIRYFDYLAETVVSIDGLSAVREIVWSPDGTQLAAVNDEGIFLVSAAGTVSPPIYTKERLTDDIKGLNWNNSDTEPLLAFRIVRKGVSEVDSWTALVVVNLNMGLFGYASPAFSWKSSVEPTGIDYRWVRAEFEADGTGIYAPIPVMDDYNYPGMKVILIHSYE